VKLPAHLVDKLQGALPIIPITGFPTLSTAFANDVDPQLVFAQLVWALGQPGDVLIGISTSGNATNVCAALETAHARGLRTLGLTGKTGGTMKPLCDVIICAPATETYLVQEYHLPIYHYISIALEEEFFGGSTLGQENP
jgi:D-sedoheptulose 7-phosphate isomerase